jgi:hypothetical protein
MKLFSAHKWWWMILLLATLIVSALTAQQVTATGLLSSIGGHLAFAGGVAQLPRLVYWLLGAPLTTEELMATITVGWLILAVANLAVMP